MEYEPGLKALLVGGEKGQAGSDYRVLLLLLMP